MFKNKENMTISMIAGIGRNREIGKGSDLLWPVPDDLKHFKEITTGHPIIMGDTTYKSIGRLLPNRTNIIATFNKDLTVPGAVVVNSLEEAFLKADDDEVFVIGGGQIYKAALPYADKLYLTLFDAENKEADIFFPDFSEFTKKTLEEEREHNGLKYSWVTFERE